MNTTYEVKCKKKTDTHTRSVEMANIMLSETQNQSYFFLRQLAYQFSKF